MKHHLSIILLSISFFLSNKSIAQGDQSVKVATIGFYNLENLFDTENDTLINDEEFLPEGGRAWTKDKYDEKISNMAYVISQMGADLSPAGISVLGVAEIENKSVLDDLVADPQISERNYQIVHYDSPDFRGIDVALLYNPKHFKVTSSEPITVDISYKENNRTTRDILHVEGLFDGEPMHVLVNHWPSRRGGEKRSQWKRDKAAKICRGIVDSLQQSTPEAKVIVMGDLNDDPTSPSVKKNLKTVSRLKELEDKKYMFNPYEDIYRRGLGSNAYRDAWSLFDQIIISEDLAKEDNDGYYFYKGQVFNKKFLIQNSGKYKGYPMRTFSFDKYQGGYSDHFPSFIYLIKKVTASK